MLSLIKDDVAIPKVPEEPHPDLMLFLERYMSFLPRSETVQTMERYVTGLLSDLPRRNGEAIANALEGITYTRIYHFLVRSPWSQEAMEHERVQAMNEDRTLSGGSPFQGRLLILDDTALPKKGHSSVGVARQYCGTLGKVANCQVVVTAHYADERYQWPVTQRLYLPRAWAEDTERRERVKVPSSVTFKSKHGIGLDLVDQAAKWEVPFECVVVDSGYGQNPKFLDGLAQRQCHYIAQVDVTFGLRLDPEATGRLEAKALFDALPEDAWETITWGEGSRGAQRRRIAAIRAHRTVKNEVKEAGWLIAERALPGHDQDEKYFFSNLPEDIDVKRIVRWGHRRWVIERFYQDAKECCGLDEYQGRSWIGLHRHMVVVNLAYTWLLEQQEYQMQSAESIHTDKNRPASYPGPSIRSVWQNWIRQILVWLIIWVVQSGLFDLYSGPL